MTNEHNFKVGDKVATTKPYDIAINGNTTTIPIGEEGVIEDISNDDLYVYFSEYHIYLTLPIWDVELIAPLDRKTAFLRELQALLRKYDARIYDGELYAIHIEIGYHNVKSEQIDYLFFNKEDSDSEINADNIMDFDKE